MGTLLIASQSLSPFRDRHEAGALLGDRLLASADDAAVVLGIPRGGMIVAQEIAQILGADLDISLTLKLTAPDIPELAIGALSEDGWLFLDPGLSRRTGVDELYLEQERQHQMSVMSRQVRQYRKIRPKIPLEGRTVVITDDGAASAASLLASIWALRRERPARLIAAVPVGSVEAVTGLSDDADYVLALKVPPVLDSVGRFYVLFDEPTDEEVMDVLKIGGQGLA
jgi:predicted phosphoribosyltransferase